MVMGRGRRGGFSWLPLVVSECLQTLSWLELSRTALIYKGTADTEAVSSLLRGQNMACTFHSLVGFCTQNPFCIFSNPLEMHCASVYNGIL